MANNMVNVSPIAFTKYPSLSFFNYQPIISSRISSESLKNEVFGNAKKRVFLAPPPLAYNKKLHCEDFVDVNIVELVKEQNDEVEEEDFSFTNDETLLYSFNPLPLMFVAALPGAGTIRSLFGPFVELVKSWNLPDWLVHWGHPGNMVCILFDPFSLQTNTKIA
ncbi:hypothetical protein HAX54_007304 [Datura stramonium]|uniref:Uncharacterized protein n=1 Tax=Datura stramonium TaxID=4076 RepID=A0ABS8TDC9_DATST|nr:hypothetical protein [Datura stramonium]